MGVRVGLRLWWGLVPLLLLLWGAGALATSSIPGLPSTPLPTLVLTPVVGYVAIVTVSVSLGCLVIGLVVDARVLRTWAVGWLVATLGVVALRLAMLQADATASQPLGIGGSVLQADVVFDTRAGQAMLAQLVVVSSAAVLMLAGRGRWVSLTALALVLLAAAAPGVAGHAGLSGEHSAAAVALGLHAGAAGVWVGGLAVLVALVAREPALAVLAVPRFSAIALVCVIVLAESGLLTASLTAGSVLDLLGTTYGSIVVAKATALGWLILFGWWQRRRVIDRLADVSVLRVLVTISAFELLLMGAALAAAVVLARIGPSVIPGTGFAPLSLVALGLAIPMLVLAIRPRGWRFAEAVPEVAAVVLAMVVVEVGGVGLLRSVLGPLGLALEVALLLGAGWAALDGARVSRSAVVLLAVALPASLIAAMMLADRPDAVRMTVVAALATEVLLLLWWRAAARRGGAAVVEPESLAGVVS